MSTSPIIVWHRRDLRLSDHPALHAACETGRPVIPVFIRDEAVDALGAAPKFRLGLGIEHLAKTYADAGSALICRSGPALDVLQALIRETGATAVYWSRLYDPVSVARDTDIKADLKTANVDARSFGGHLLFEPWDVANGSGSFYRVYSPYWKAVMNRDVAAPLPRPARIAAPESWPASEALGDWGMASAMRRGADIVRQHLCVGEDAAQERLAQFVENRIGAYKARRDFPAEPATSHLSENLTVGEITPYQCWHAGMRAREEGAAGAEHFLKEVVWREFAYHLMHHTPEILTENWKPGWDAFPWSEDEEHPHVLAWKQGRTGERFVDTAMREMYVTGHMHNRARMIVASYLTKHLMTHWKIGLAWFEDCLIDWDPASNAMGWQWAAGSGPDAAPYFRVFNPATQLEKFDPMGAYQRRWIAEGVATPHQDAVSYFDAIPKSWNLSATDRYPRPVVALDDGRKRALAAYEARTF